MSGSSLLRDDLGGSRSNLMSLAALAASDEDLAATAAMPLPAAAAAASTAANKFLHHQTDRNDNRVMLHHHAGAACTGASAAAEEEEEEFSGEYGVEDISAAAIESASFIFPELNGPDVADILEGMNDDDGNVGPVHVSTPSLPLTGGGGSDGGRLAPAPQPRRRLNFSGLPSDNEDTSMNATTGGADGAVPPTPFNSFAEEAPAAAGGSFFAESAGRSSTSTTAADNEDIVMADIEAAVVAEAAHLERQNKLKLALASAALAAASATSATSSEDGSLATTASGSADGAANAANPKRAGGCSSNGHANRKDVCKGMSVEEVERLSEDKRVTEYKAPTSVYDKEVRRRDKIATYLSMLRQVVPGITPETDNTAVFEMTANYVTFLKEKVGDKEKDKMFLKERMTL